MRKREWLKARRAAIPASEAEKIIGIIAERREMAEVVLKETRDRMRPEDFATGEPSTVAMHVAFDGGLSKFKRPCVLCGEETLWSDGICPECHNKELSGR
jgi:hypothetical protein